MVVKTAVTGQIAQNVQLWLHLLDPMMQYRYNGIITWLRKRHTVYPHTYGA